MRSAIVVMAFDRVVSISRLLNSLSALKNDSNIVTDLIINVDFKPNNSVSEIVDRFAWKYGRKIINKHENNIGLRNNFIYSGHISKDYDYIIILEDDLIVSNDLIDYSNQSVMFFMNDSKIAGISLYSYRINEFSSNRPFYPLMNGYDNFFLQVPSSWGLVLTKSQWSKFYDWYSQNQVLEYSNLIPKTVFNWDASSWKKYFYYYIVKNDLFFSYPYNSISTNMSNKGTHNISNTNLYQTQLKISNYTTRFNFVTFDSEKSIKYDSFFESINIINFFQNKNTLVNYYGNNSKKIDNFEYLLSSSKLPFKIEKSWDLSLIPFELNIQFNIQGDDIFLYKIPNSSKVKVKYSYSDTQLIYDYPIISRIKLLNLFKLNLILSIKRKFNTLINKIFN